MNNANGINSNFAFKQGVLHLGNFINWLAYGILQNKCGWGAIFKNKIMNKEIKSKKEYHENMVVIYNLMNKGENNLTKAELQILTTMSIAAENYEETVVGLNHPFQTK